MSKQLNSDEIRIYLSDLSDIMTEHEESACFECKADITGKCTFYSVITVEIVTYERKLSEIV